MTQTHHTPAPIPARTLAWSQALQAKLMDALDAAWAMIERSDDPAQIRKARDRAKAIGELAAMARKVALIVPLQRVAPAAAAPAGPAAPILADLAPVAAQAEHARRALKLKGGGRARL
ncbi:hypothetical protein [Caulobacter soli]|uniref:hypothetical protein n=1 Tax=Caulobacter soli TaxID=2708539 RepID=UPI0013EB5B39|nr:hypothetical protein [Caulobacter soli]